MVINFPKTQEIKLKHPPLDEVICQVKFSPILSITSDSPTDFQESIRNRFPGLEVQHGVLFKFPAIGANEKPFMGTAPKIYHFLTADRKSTVALTDEFCAITTKAYCHWDDFIKDIELVGNTVVKTYHPAHATRIGLRFINKFTMKNTYSNSIREVLDLFRGELTCLIQTEAWQDPGEFVSQMVLADNKAKLALRVGFGNEKKTPFFVLDFDYFEEGQLRIEKLTTIVEKYHARIYDAFRWCLKNESLKKFEPIEEN